ncbi:MAG: hypothetical protein K6E29_03655, partial [Cyanobacteria bacterium RUI128]|nr:hypothetical protein [Cyanobacteria bacterium RUI128]
NPSLLTYTGAYNFRKLVKSFYCASANTDFHYMGGHDKYESLSQDNNSDNYYIDKFDTTTDLAISDWGGDDSIIFSNTNIDDLRIAFNVYKDGTYGFDGNYDNYAKDCTTLSLLNKDSFNMTNTTEMKKNKQRQGMIQISNFFQLNYTSEYNEETNSWTSIPDKTVLTIETSKAKDNDGNINEIDMTKWIESISSDVAQWLTKNNYATTYDAMDKAKPTKLAELLNIYNVDYYTAINKNN